MEHKGCERSAFKKIKSRKYILSILSTYFVQVESILYVRIVYIHYNYIIIIILIFMSEIIRQHNVNLWQSVH